MMHKSGTSEATRSASKCTCTRAAGSHRQPASPRVKAAEWENVSQATSTWIVLSVRPLTEFETAERLRDDGFSALVPTERKYVRISRYSRRREPRDYPLFPRYLFAGILGNWREVLQDCDVVGILGKPERPYQLSAAEIAWIHALADGQTEVTGMNLHNALRAGQWAQIAQGPLSGALGYIDRIRGQRASVLTEMLGVWRAIEMPLDALEVA